MLPQDRKDSASIILCSTVAKRTKPQACHSFPHYCTGRTDNKRVSLATVDHWLLSTRVVEEYHARIELTEFSWKRSVALLPLFSRLLQSRRRQIWAPNQIIGQLDVQRALSTSTIHRGEFAAARILCNPSQLS